MFPPRSNLPARRAWALGYLSSLAGTGLYYSGPCGRWYLAGALHHKRDARSGRVSRIDNRKVACQLVLTGMERG